MTLPPGTRLGQYEVVALLGAGGMGEVYRAHDTTLQRDVALKLLPASFASDADRLARFEREARTLAGLNHPHIAQVYGFDTVTHAGGSGRALAMELVEGEDLSQMLARGALPLSEALTLARQITEALEAAHAQGIVHRDLKPANIKVRADGTVKILDFGLAKALESGPAGAVANSPTITSPAMTRAGIILGTAAYMAPEQARGRVVDHRADVWAFGCVLFEMLTGRRAFEGDEITDILAKVIERDPDWTWLPADMPAAVRRLLTRALQKDRAQRLQHIGDARIEIDEALGSHDSAHGPPPGRPSAWRRWARAAGYAAAAIFGALVALGTSTRPAEAPSETGRAVQFDVSILAPNLNRAALSPDGRYIAYTQPASPGQMVLWLRDLSRPTAERLGDLPAAGSPLWLPDSSSVYVLANETLRRFDLRERTSVELPIPAPNRLPVLTMTVQSLMLADRRVVVGSNAVSEFRALQLWTVEGMTPLLALDERVHEVRQALPARIDDDRISYASYRTDGSVHLCVTAVSVPAARCVGRLDQTSRVHYHDGRVVFVRGPSLLARSIDLGRLAFTGDEQQLAGGVAATSSQRGLTFLDVSTTGVVMFAAGTADDRLAWQTVAGAETPIVELPVTTNMALAPDGRRALVTDQRALHLIDLQSHGTARLGPSEGDPIWAPDGRRFAHRTTAGIVVRAVDDAQESVVVPGALTGFPEDWSNDGRLIAVGLRSGLNQIALVAVAGGAPIEFLNREDGLTQADEMHFSPDGRWLAFNALSGSRQEVFVVPVPPTRQRWQVSSAGGVQGRWHPSGRTLYFLDPNGTMMAADVSQGATFSAAAPRPLFDTGLNSSYNFDDYRVAPDGRFLMKKPRFQGTLRLIVNWPELLK